MSRTKKDNKHTERPNYKRDRRERLSRASRKALRRELAATIKDDLCEGAAYAEGELPLLEHTFEVDR